MAKRGKMAYIPPVIIDELEDIRREDGIGTRVDAFQQLVKYARVGREAKRLINFGDFSKKKKGRKKVSDYPVEPQPYDISGGMFR